MQLLSNIWRDYEMRKWLFSPIVRVAPFRLCCFYKRLLLISPAMRPCVPEQAVVHAL